MSQPNKKLDESKLQPCDVVLTTSDAIVSKKIRLHTASDISHAMIYVENHSIIDSTGEGVHSHNTQRLKWPVNAGVHVLRLKDQLSGYQQRLILDFARQKVGTQYSTFEAVAAKFGGKRTVSKKQFCSRFVAQAYASAEINVVKDANYCTPADLLKSPYFIEIEHATIPVTPEFEAAIENIPDTTKLMRDTTNKLLSDARNINKTIQNLNDIDHYLIVSPSFDGEFAKIYRKSGYLAVCDFEYTKNPWQYDLNLLEQIPIRFIEKIAYCMNLLNEQDEGKSRFDVNFRGYQLYYSQYKLETFELLLELYSKLVEHHNKRRKVAEQWLLINKPDCIPVSKKSGSLIPHTDMWFYELRSWNPIQASITKTVIEAAGSVEVCSVCGDDPAQDYLLMDEAPKVGSVLTLRLCNDCLKIRSNQFKELFTLLKP